MEIVKVRVFTSGEDEHLNQEENESSYDDTQEQEFVTNKIKDHCTNATTLLLDLPSNIGGELGVINKFLTRSVPVIKEFDNSFYLDFNYFDYSKTDSRLRSYLSFLFYKILSVNIIMEMKKYIISKDRVMFELVESNIPEFLDMDLVNKVINYILRSRGVNTIRTVYEGENHIIVENNNSKESKYLLNILNPKVPIDIDIYRIYVYDILEKLDQSIFYKLYLDSISTREEVIEFDRLLNESCNMINSEEFTYDVVSRLKQLYLAIENIFKGICLISGFKLTEVNESIKARTVNNEVKYYCDECIKNGFRFENYLDICNKFTAVIINTDNFNHATEEINLYEYCELISKGVITLYKDTVSLYYSMGKVNTCYIKEGEIFWE